MAKTKTVNSSEMVKNSAMRGTQASTAPKTVGAFTHHPNGSIEGPAQYLEEQGNATIEQINAGKNTVFYMLSKTRLKIHWRLIVF